MARRESRCLGGSERRCVSCREIRCGSRREFGGASRHPSTRGPRVGFTLVELMVALVISGIALVCISALLTQIADGADRITAAARAADRDANGERLLRTLLHRLEVGTDAGARFEGSEAVARFTTWCDMPAGWLERCRAAIVVDTVKGAPALTVVLSTGEVIAVRAGFEAGALRYIADPSGGGTWFRIWGIGITAPLAIGVILDADTLILRIGERG